MMRDGDLAIHVVSYDLLIMTLAVSLIFSP